MWGAGGPRSSCGHRCSSPWYFGHECVEPVLSGAFWAAQYALFDVPSVSGASKAVVQALKHCQVSAVHQESHTGKVGLLGRSACRIPGETVKVVTATCSGHFAGKTVLFELPEAGLPAGLLASAALTRVTRSTVYVPVLM